MILRIPHQARERKTMSGMHNPNRGWSLRPVRALRTFIILGIVLMSVTQEPIAQSPQYDLLLRNGRIVDGSGSPWYRGDVALKGDTIVRISSSIEGPAIRVIDVGGQVIAP